jgi:Flp pilus assembly protein TadB
MEMPKFSFSNVSMKTVQRDLKGSGLLFVPGLCLVLMGVVALLAPRLILALVAGLFLFLGAVLCVVALKVAQLQRKFTRMAREFEGRIVVQGVNVVPQTDIQVEPSSKKIVYH